MLEVFINLDEYTESDVVLELQPHRCNKRKGRSQSRILRTHLDATHHLHAAVCQNNPKARAKAHYNMTLIGNDTGNDLFLCFSTPLLDRKWGNTTASYLHALAEFFFGGGGFVIWMCCRVFCPILLFLKCLPCGFLCHDTGFCISLGLMQLRLYQHDWSHLSQSHPKRPAVWGRELQ